MRIPHLRKAFIDARLRLAPKGTPEHEALTGVLRSLVDESVPLVGPHDRSVPHGPLLMGRPVPGTDLVVCYVPAGNEVTLVNLVRDH